MKLINWNLNRSSLDRFRHQMAAIVPHNGDILAFTEVGIKAGPEARQILGDYGYEHVLFSHELGNQKPRMSGVLFASRFPFKVLPEQVAVPERLWFRVLSVEFETTTGVVEGHVVHVPPGSSWGWMKVEFFQALYKHLACDSSHPRFLAGDFNSPRLENADGTVEVFSNKNKEVWEAAEQCHRRARRTGASRCFSSS